MFNGVFDIKIMVDKRNHNALKFIWTLLLWENSNYT